MQRVITPILFLLAFAASGASAQTAYELSVESTAGAGDFDSNVLGTVTPLDSPSQTVVERYNHTNYTYASTTTPTQADIGESYSLFFVETSEGLALFTIWGTTSGTYSTASTTSTGPFASMPIADEPVGGVDGSSGIRADNITLVGNTIAAVNAETYQGYTDGYAALLTPGDPTPIYFEVDNNAASSGGTINSLGAAGIRVFSNDGAGGVTSTQVTPNSLGPNLNRRVRLRPAQMTVGSNVTPVNREGWRLLSAPVSGLDVMDLAQMNLVVGVEAGSSNGAQFPDLGYINPRNQLAGNLFHAYTGVESTPHPETANDSTALIYVPVPDSDYTFTPGEGLWWYWYHPDATYNLTPGSFGGGEHGTNYNLLDANFSLAANGSLMNDDVSVSFPLATILPLTYDENGDGTPDADVARDYFYMGGNPFAAPFDVNGISATNGTVQGVVYAWDPNKANGSGGFGAHQAIPRDGSSDRFASVWQGFMIEVTPTPEAIAGDLGPTITYAAGSTDAAQSPSFYGKTADGPLAQYHFSLSGTTADGRQSQDDAWLRFLPDAERGFDRHDGSKYADAPARIAFSTQERRTVRRLAMNALPDGSAAPLPHKMNVPLDFAASEAGTYTLAWDGELPAGWKAFLVDRETEGRIKMWRETSYTFSAAAGDWTNRFVITVRPGSDVTSAAPEAETLAKAETRIGETYPNPAAGTSRIEVVLGAEQPVRVAVYDALGREVAVAHDGPLAEGSTAVALPVASLAAGTYAVRVTGEGLSETRRLTVTR